MFRANRIRDLPTIVLIALALVLLLISAWSANSSFAQTEIDVGFSTSHGVVDKQQTVIDITRAKGNTILSGQWRYTETEGESIEEKGLARAEYNRPLSENWKLWSFEQAGYDIAREIQLENFVGLGPRFTFLATKELDLSLSIGGLYHTVNYRDGTQESLYRASVRPKFRGEWERWELKAVAFYQPALENCHNYILSGLASLRYAITDKVGLKFSVEDEFRSVSIGENNNLSTSLSLSWGF